jgi:hypothetical protein
MGRPVGGEAGDPLAHLLRAALVIMRIRRSAGVGEPEAVARYLE